MSFLPASREPQLLDNRLGDVVLHGEHVGDLPIERIGPDLDIVCGLHELCVHLKGAVGTEDRAYEQQIGTELGGGLTEISSPLRETPTTPRTQSAVMPLTLARLFWIP